MLIIMTDTQGGAEAVLVRGKKVITINSIIDGVGVEPEFDARLWQGNVR